MSVAKFATEQGHQRFIVKSRAPSDAIGVGVVTVCKGSSNSRKVSDIIRLKSKLDQGQLVLDGLVSHKVNNILRRLKVVFAVGGAAGRLPRIAWCSRGSGTRQLAVREHGKESSRLIIVRDRLSEYSTALACLFDFLPRVPHQGWIRRRSTERPFKLRARDRNVGSGRVELSDRIGSQGLISLQAHASAEEAESVSVLERQSERGPAGSASSDARLLSVSACSVVGG